MYLAGNITLHYCLHYLQGQKLSLGHLLNPIALRMNTVLYNLGNSYYNIVGEEQTLAILMVCSCLSDPILFDMQIPKYQSIMSWVALHYS